MTKQEKIKEAYGEYWETIKNNLNLDAWLLSENCYSVEEIRVYNFFHDSYIGEIGHNKVRPKSLKGIENNKGWIKIESENDLPKEEGNYLPFHKMEYPQSTETYSKNVIHKLFEMKVISHYQPIQKPEPPIY